LIICEFSVDMIRAAEWREWAAFKAKEVLG